MKVYIAANPLGIFAADENGNIIDKFFFKMVADEVAKKLLSTDLTEEEKELLKRLKGNGYKQLVLAKRTNEFEFETNNLGERILRKKIRQIAHEMKIQEAELNKFLTELGIELSRMRIKETVKKDSIVIQMVNGVDELDKSINIFVARIREIYGLHFPEFEQNIDNHEKFVKIISEYGLRENIPEDVLKINKNSMGIDLSEEDGKIVMEYAAAVRKLYKLREDMERYIGKVMNEIAPNFSKIATPLVGARLMALTGGLDKLAKKPSSTLQLLGAEKAFFRYLRGKGRSPKFGVIYTHPMIQKSPADKKGKIARMLASKMSIAIKMDYYGKTDRSKEMKRQLEGMVTKIMAGKDA